jgi:hypothetical protein
LIRHISSQFSPACRAGEIIFSCNPHPSPLPRT